MSYIGPTIWLTGLWVILWRSVTPGTIVTGIVLALLLTWAVRRSDAHRVRHRVHLLPLLRFFGHMGVELVKSNIALGFEVLTPTDYTKPGLLEVRLPTCSELVLTVIANSITLTPGTMTLELRAETSTLLVHVLHLSDVEAARDEIRELHRLVSAALVPVATADESGAEIT